MQQKLNLIYIKEGSCNPAEFLIKGNRFVSVLKGSEAKKIAKKLKLKDEEEFDVVFKKRRKKNE